MWTETYGQLVDRLIIARLKEWHYTHDGRVEAADLAHEQVVALSTAVDRYADDCFSGRLIPRVQRHLRYHDHNKVEAWREGKQATSNAPDTIAKCIALLVDTHSTYWRAQSRIQALKKLIDNAPDCANSDRPHFERELVHEQRQGCDLANQARNELIEQIDCLFARCVEIHEVNKANG